ncbi:NADH-cytochrome b5 reductase [Gryganskiella cystojenkinii]|nr:NADH-cytochrome b5 reductase [Gryganskiella cystojenkinii]
MSDTAIAVALDPNAFVDFKLKSIETLTPNTSKFVFELLEEQVLGMTVASCFMTKFVNEEGKNVIRPYTPTSESDVKGSFEFVVKKYETGVMSGHIHNLKVGETLAIKGPMTKYALKPNQHQSVSLIAGGTGIAPMLQLISSILKNKDEDKTKIHLIFGNISVDDIILKDKIDALAKENPEQFKVTYVVDKASKGWEGETGYITAELIKKHIPEIGSAGNQVFVCGPPPMMVAVSGPKGPNYTQGEVSGALQELGLTIEQVYKF